MHYLQFLERLHERLAPPTYLEIGVRKGRSLALSHAQSIGIDPAFKLTEELSGRVALFEETSDAYFARRRPLKPFGGRPASLSFIDGMHLAEYALRDFINVERHAHWTSVIVLHDVLPRKVEEAARNRTGRGWAGDVYKIVRILTRHRPDLITLRVPANPTGLLLVLGLDPASRVLADHYDGILAETVVPDPQDVPIDILERREVVDPNAVLSASFWSLLREGRERDALGREGIPRLSRAVHEQLPEARPDQP